MKRFSDFAKEENILDGEKLKLDNVLNCEIEVIGFKIKDSQYKKTTMTNI